MSATQMITDAESRKRPEGKQVINFDGVCCKCNGVVNFVVDNDPNTHFRRSRTSSFHASNSGGQLFQSQSKAVRVRRRGNRTLTARHICSQHVSNASTSQTECLTTSENGGDVTEPVQPAVPVPTQPEPSAPPVQPVPTAAASVAPNPVGMRGCISLNSSLNGLHLETKHLDINHSQLPGLVRVLSCGSLATMPGTSHMLIAGM